MNIDTATDSLLRIQSALKDLGAEQRAAELAKARELIHEMAGVLHRITRSYSDEGEFSAIKTELVEQAQAILDRE